MKKLYFLLFTISLLCIGIVGHSQISQGGLPLSFQNSEKISAAVPVEIMPAVNVNQLMAEDSLNEIYKDVPWRFGENIPVNFDPDNSGKWDVLGNGARIWRIGIRCQGAYTINLTFDNYRLPPGAKLFVYNIDRSNVFGAFTDFNNRDDSAFATTLVKGDEVVIEYNEPADPSFPGKLHLNQVTHGYRDAFKYIKSFGQSGACENNVHCPEAATWQNQVRAACMLVTGGNGFCSGSLVNNTSQDGTPYILTANHCYSNPATWVFWFNWESPDCPNPPSSPTYNSISGATLKARYSDSDFCLVEMSSIPPSNFNVYYEGWNKKDTAASSGACVHHPSGDIKKISYSDQPFVSSTWSGTPPNSHWQVFWTDGVTEPGSSGSPMFDQYHHVVGQLHGGPSACNASQLWDFYGKFSMSWDRGTTPATRLKDWLDPTGIAGDTLGGFDPNQVPVVQTLAATNVDVTSATLNGSITPNGFATSYHFDWGTTVGFGDTTTTQPAGSGFTPVPVTAPITGLTAETQYFFRLVGTSGSGTFFGDTLTFTTSAVPSLTVSPPNQIVGTPSGTTSFIVTSNISWTVTSDASWCTVTPSGTGNDTIDAIYTENTSVTPRIAHISVSGTGVTTQVVTVSQDGIPVILSVVPPNRNVIFIPGTTSFYVTSNTDWTVTSNSSWCTVTPSGSGNDSIHAVFEVNNLNTSRIDTIIVSATGAASQMVTVTQAEPFSILTVTPPNRDVTATTGSTSFTVTTTYSWEATSDAPWCTITASGTGDGTIVANYTGNVDQQPRTAHIQVICPQAPPYFNQQNVTVTQAKPGIGIGENNLSNVKIYPNPTKGVFRIVPPDGTENLDLTVETINGSSILRKECKGKKEYQIDLSQCTEGTYNIILKTEKETIVRKLVIIK